MPKWRVVVFLTMAEKAVLLTRRHLDDRRSDGRPIPSLRSPDEDTIDWERFS